jgi:phytoene synthase
MTAGEPSWPFRSIAPAFYAEAESGIGLLSEDARWPVWSALALYRQILDVIEDNGYDVFTQRAFVPSLRKLLTLRARCSKRGCSRR